MEEEKTLKEKLEEQWADELAALSVMDINDECYDIQMSRVEHLEKLMADLDKAELEASTKMEQLDSDRSEQKRKSKIEIFKTSAPIIAAFLMGCISMVWEKQDTLTSTAGKSSLRDLLRFK